METNNPTPTAVIQLYDRSTGEYCGCYWTTKPAPYEVPEFGYFIVENDKTARSWFVPEELDSMIDRALAETGCTMETSILTR